MAAPTQEDLLVARLQQQIIDFDGDDDEEDNFEDDEEAEGDCEDGSGKSKRSRIEKKNRKAMLKLGMAAVTGVSRVTMKKSTNPDVYKVPNSDMYLIFGKVQIEDLSSQRRNQAAEKFRSSDQNQFSSKAESSSGSALTTYEEDDVDETGFHPRDIELVMEQARVSRSKAVKAMEAANGDIVTAILDLTN